MPSAAATSAAPSAVVTPAAASVAGRLSSVRSAAAEFASADLTKIPAEGARGAGDALMDRVLGAESIRVEGVPAVSAGAPVPFVTRLSASDADAPRAGVPAAGAQRRPRLYLFSSPLRRTAELGVVARVLHYALEIGLQFVKGALVWKATGSVAAGLGVLAIELLKTPPMITAQSLMDLELRYWWQRRQAVRAAARAEGVTRVRVLTTGDVEYDGILARRKDNAGLVFVESAVVPTGAPADLGVPLVLADPRVRRVRLTLAQGEKTHPVAWETTLGSLLVGRALPDRVAKQWRMTLAVERHGKGLLARLTSFPSDLRVEAALEDGRGGWTELGAVAVGKSALSLSGDSSGDRLRAVFGRLPRPRAIPVFDATVERGGRRIARGFWRRAWRRLTGRLVVL